MGGIAGLSKTHDIQDRLPIPHRKNFIANNANKAALLNFIAESWMENARSLPQGFKLILGGMLKDPGKAVLLTIIETAVVTELSCSSHEETDTRIFCHLLCAVQDCGYQRADPSDGLGYRTHGNLPRCANHRTPRTLDSETTQIPGLPRHSTKLCHQTQRGPIVDNIGLA